MTILHVPSFSGGVILGGSADAQATTEVRQADNWDIGLRGQFMSAPTLSAFLQVNDIGTIPAPVAPIAVGTVKYANSNPQAILVSFGKNASNAVSVLLSQVALRAGLSGNPAVLQTVAVAGFTPPTDPVINTLKTPWVTFAPFPYVNGAGVQTQAMFVNIGGRYDDANAREFPGLYVLVFDGTNYTFHPISDYDSLGTGPDGEFTGGTRSLQLYPRGIAVYNNHLFAFGFDGSDATHGEGPARLSFSNIANPFKWGNDNIGTSGTNRPFTDSDAIQVGNGGEAITALLSAMGNLWIGTNRGLHYLQGYGRDSFTTDGTTSVAAALDVTSPYGLIEGPDGHVYGLSSRGLWRYVWQWHLSHIEHLYRKLVAFDGTSNGYWDLLQGAGAIRGNCNIDLAWMRSDVPRQQVWVVIPGCNATTGTGLGNDTVIIKYHIEGGGFSRQVLFNVLWYPSGEMRKGGTITDLTVIPVNTGTTLQTYGGGTPSTGTLKLGEYAPFGPDGDGIVRTFWLTLSWLASSALPITATVTPLVDEQLLPVVNLTIGATAPASPSDGDVWVDTSGSDTNIGNATAGTLIPSTGDYLCKRWMASWNKFIIISSAGGMQGVRVTVPIAFRAVRGARNSFIVSSNASGIIQFEGLGMEPSGQAQGLPSGPAPDTNSMSSLPPFAREAM